MKTIPFSDFAKLDLRTAKILKAEDIPEADKLYKLTIDVGDLGKRTICAGIKQFYSPDDLRGKKVIVLANLEPRKMKVSKGMILAAVSNDEKQVVLLQPDADIESGSKIS